jgi:hypothetical protein
LQPVVRRRPAANKYLLAWNDGRAPFVISTALRDSPECGRRARRSDSARFTRGLFP